jgi:hypothetical protein
MTVQAITSEAAQAAVPPTRGATGHRTARAASGSKRKNSAKKNIAKPRVGRESRTPLHGSSLIVARPQGEAKTQKDSRG